MKPRAIELPDFRYAKWEDLKAHDVDWATREITTPAERVELVVVKDLKEAPPLHQAIRRGYAGFGLGLPQYLLTTIWKKVQAPLRSAAEEVFEDWNQFPEGITTILLYGPDNRPLDKV